MPNDPILPSRPVTRRAALCSALATAGAAATAAGAAPTPKPDSRRASPKRYDMKKSINLWAFP